MVERVKCQVKTSHLPSGLTGREKERSFYGGDRKRTEKRVRILKCLHNVILAMVHKIYNIFKKILYRVKYVLINYFLI